VLAGGGWSLAVTAEGPSAVTARCGARVTACAADRSPAAIVSGCVARGFLRGSQSRHAIAVVATVGEQVVWRVPRASGSVSVTAMAKRVGSDKARDAALGCGCAFWRRGGQGAHAEAADRDVAVLQSSVWR